MQTLVVDVNNTGIPEGAIDLVEHLPNPMGFQDEARIVLRFATKRFVYITGLGLLATWRTALPSNVSVDVDDAGCEEPRKVAASCGFLDIIQKGAGAQLSAYHTAGRVPIQPIVQGSNTESTISAICRVLADFTGPLHDSRPFNQMLSELSENTFVHAEFQTPGYICSNYHRTPNKLEIAISDSGIGIRASYAEGTNEDAKNKIASGASPIELAIEGLYSSKRDPAPGSWRSHFGYGPFLVRRLIEENRGRLTIISGDE